LNKKIFFVPCKEGDDSAITITKILKESIFKKYSMDFIFSLCNKNNKGIAQLSVIYLFKFSMNKEW